MEKLTILIDMDDTIEDLVPAWAECLNKRYGTNVSPEDITDWNIRMFFPDVPVNELFGLLEEEEFWKTVKPKPNASTYVKRLIDDGHTVFIVTSSHYKTITQKMENVLFRHFPYLTWDNVIITSSKQMVRGHVLIDDGIHNHTGRRRARILMDAPHNRKFDAEKYGMVRVKNWAEAYDCICKLSKERGW